MSRDSLTPWPRTETGLGGTIASMATRIGQKRRAHLYIQEWFTHRGLGDAQVAARLGLDRTTIWKWRTKPSRMDPGKMEALAGVLEIEPNELYRPPSAPQAISLDEIAKDYPDDLKQKAADIVRLLGKTG